MRAFSLIVLIVLFAIVIAPTAPPAAETAAEEQMETKIASATIYSGIAQVTRTGRIDVKKGIYRIVCEDLPAGFNESSLQVEGAGTARAAILGVDIIELPGEVSETPKYKELKERLESLEAGRDSLQITLQSLHKRREFITSLGSYPFQEQKEKEPLDIFRVQDWKNLMDFLEKERILVERKLYDVGIKAKKIMEKIEWIKMELNTMRVKAQWKKLVAIDCEVASAGHLDFDLSYIVEGADWTPEYNVRYAAADDIVELTYNARIRQVTGEDWKNVSVILSTARPQIGAAPPELEPYYVVMRQRAPLGYGYDKESKLEETIVGKTLESEALVRIGGELHVRGGSSAYTPPTAPVSQAEMISESSDFATNLTIKKAVDLESGADPKRVTVLRQELTGEFSRNTVPRLSQNVFIRGGFENTLGIPILSGGAEVYIETPGPGGKGRTSNFVGKETLEPVIAGEEFELHLGADQDIKVEHERVKKERLTKRGAKTTKIRYSYLITLESFKKDSVEVTVQDRIPVSSLKDIKIEKIDIDPKPGEEQDDGILTWILEMAPGGKQEITIAYTISFPGDWPERSLNIE
jgi:uncharacterized protein (TIGR02231 family)